MDASIERAARAVAEADALLITAGAGMGVDSGLPDFRGNEGFWNAYPPMRALGYGLVQMANPRWFRDDPPFAWGFYGHRLSLYRRTTPHAGFQVLRRIAADKPRSFVFTSNVDGAFQRAGFDADHIVECHGAIDFMQCTKGGCGVGIYPADDYEPEVDETTFRAAAPLPACPRCGGLARPNILMFGDFEWDGARTGEQEERFEGFLRDVIAGQASPARSDNFASGGALVVVECGAGTAVPTIRMLGDRLARREGVTLVRINVREPEVPFGHIGLSMGALDALTQIEAAMR